MRYFSTFSGIGGFELGINQAYGIPTGTIDSGGEQQQDPQGGASEVSVGSESFQPSQLPERGDHTCVGYSEIDPFAIQIYEKHFGHLCDRSEQAKQGTRTAGRRPSLNGKSGSLRNEKSNCGCKEHKNYGDITKINASTLPDFDLLCGGFPCQAFSIAGKRGGFDDTRGTLFFDIARILKAKRPRLCLLENVKGLLSHDNGRTIKVIFSTLTELGYDLQWQVLNSKDFGVPQNRERIFIIGHLRGTARPEVFPFRVGAQLSDTSGGEGEAKHKIASALTANYRRGVHSQGETYAIQQLNHPTHSNDRIYDPKGISPALNTAQGGRRQPKIVETINPRKLDGSQTYQQDRIYKTDGAIPAISAGLGGRFNIQDPKVISHYGHKDKPPVESKIAPTLKANSHGHEPMIYDDYNHTLRKDGNAGTLTRNAGQKAEGNGQKVVIAKTVRTGGLMSPHESKQSWSSYEVEGRIRRLTPLECERLQGFPDGWTAGLSDTQRYKTLGNAVTVNVIREIAKRLV